MLSKKQHYLQIALNADLHTSLRVLSTIPVSDRIIIEVGTPLIKEYGQAAISRINDQWKAMCTAVDVDSYVVADMKCFDRARREVEIADQGGADGAVVLGTAPIATINEFIVACEECEMDSMVDMMNVAAPYQVLRKMHKLPSVVILHRGVDEEDLADAALPIHMINKLKGTYPVLIAMAGGDKPREIQSAAFNGADIVVLWRKFYSVDDDIADVVNEFLKEIK